MEEKLSEKEITALLKEQYNIAVKSINRIKRGTSNVYEIYDSNNNHIVLKEFQSYYTEEQIQNEINIINHLRKDNIPVPNYVKTKNDNYFLLTNNKYIIVQEFIEGTTLPNNGGNYKQTIELASCLGKITASLETLGYKLPKSDFGLWYKKETYQKNIKNMEHLINKTTDKQIKECLKEKIKMIENLNIDTSNFDKITYKNCHGDFNIMQIIYDNNKIKAVMDFTSCSYMPVIWEIIRSYSLMDQECKDGAFNIKIFVDYVKETKKYIELSKYDLECMPYIYLIQLLNSSYGFKQYIDNNNEISLLNFGYLRFKISKYLFENADKISKKLIKELGKK